MNGVPVVSVCVANYNGRDVVDACLQSVLDQEGGPVVEVIVHDDASTDGSAAYIRERYPEVILIESPTNVGFCVANNRMAAAARGRYLLLLNDDATLFPDAMRTLLSDTLRLGEPAILGLRQYDAATGGLLDIGSLLDPFLNPVPNLDSTRQDVGMVMGSCLWSPKALWDEIGGFPEWFGSIGEDLYLCCRARLAGAPVRVSAASGYRHRVGRSFGGGKLADRRMVTTFRRRALSERNRTFVMIASYPTVALALLLPVHLALLVLESLVLSVLRRDRRFWTEITLPAVRGVVAERKRLRRLRDGVQADKRIGFLGFFAPFTWVPRKLAMLLRHGLPTVH